jgi:hypothetical protein
VPSLQDVLVGGVQDSLKEGGFESIASFNARASYTSVSVTETDTMASSGDG